MKTALELVQELRTLSTVDPHIGMGGPEVYVSKSLLADAADRLEAASIRGRWEEHHSGGCWCSACGRWVPYSHKPRYCENCGARMNLA